MKNFAQRIADKATFPSILVASFSGIAGVILIRVIPDQFWQWCTQFFFLAPFAFLERWISLVPSFGFIVMLLVLGWFHLRGRKKSEQEVSRLQMLLQNREGILQNKDAELKSEREIRHNEREAFEREPVELKNPPHKIVHEFNVCWYVDLKKRQVIPPPICPTAGCFQVRQRLTFSYHCDDNGQAALLICPTCEKSFRLKNPENGMGLTQPEAIRQVSEKHIGREKL